MKGAYVGKIVLMKTLQEESWGLGYVVGYQDKPVYLCEMPDGKQKAWIASAVVEATEFQKEQYYKAKIQYLEQKVALLEQKTLLSGFKPEGQGFVIDTHEEHL